MRLEIVLTTSKVPHEIAPIHEIDLVTEEELEVLSKSWAIVCFGLSAIFITYFFALDICPCFVSIHMVCLARVHTWEEHFELVHVYIGILVPRYYIAIFLALDLWCRSILGMSLFLNRYTHIALHLEFYRCVVCLSVEQRCISILLAVEVVLEREDIVGGVLVHWRVGIGADHDSSIATITNNHNRHHHSNGIEPTGWDNIFLHKKDNKHCDNQKNTNQCALLDEWYTSKRHRQNERNNRRCLELAVDLNHTITFPYSPYEC